MRCLRIRLILTAMLLLTISCAVTGCLFQTTKTTIVWSSLTPTPIEATGAVRVATNEPIDIEVIGTGVYAKKDMGGRILMHIEEYSEMIKRMKENIEFKKRIEELEKQLGRQPEKNVELLNCSL